MTKHKLSGSGFSRSAFMSAAVLALVLAAYVPSRAQQIFGVISGTVKDSTGAVVQDVTVKARNLATN